MNRRWKKGEEMEDNQMTRQEFQSIVKALEETPQRVQLLAGELTDDDSAWKPSATEWSVLEHVCHLSDIEREGYAVRIEKLISETEPFLADLDGDQLARERSYNSQNFLKVLRAFTDARAENVRVIKALPLEHLNRRGTFEKVGTVTLAQLLIMLREHDEGHLQDIRALRDQLIERRKNAPLSAAR
jgi:type I restriction-modification system DNA methylase subunit